MKGRGGEVTSEGVLGIACVTLYVLFFLRSHPPLLTSTRTTLPSPILVALSIVTASRLRRRLRGATKFAEGQQRKEPQAPRFSPTDSPALNVVILYKTKATGLLRVLVDAHYHPLDRTCEGKMRMNQILGSIKGQISNINSGRFHGCLQLILYRGIRFTIPVHLGSISRQKLGSRLDHRSGVGLCGLMKVRT